MKNRSLPGSIAPVATLCGSSLFLGALAVVLGSCSPPPAAAPAAASHTTAPPPSALGCSDALRECRARLSAAATPAAIGSASGPADAPAPPKPVVRLAGVPVLLRHVTLFDGTLAPPKQDQSILIENGTIAKVGPASELEPGGAHVVDLPGHAVLPGLVGMHNHLYYIAHPAGDPSDVLLPELFYSAPRLYLAGGVTTMRTTGSVEPYADLNLRRLIEQGKVPGPDIDVTAPYLEGPGGPFPQMPVVKTADEARRFVAYWADQGATSIKAYMHIPRDALRAAIVEAHRRKLKVTGHLCSVTYAEAAAMGIDDLEHGFFVATDFAESKKPDECPSGPGSVSALLRDPASAEVKALIKTLVSRHVALTSTLPVFEQFVTGRSQDPRAVALLAPYFEQAYRSSREEIDARGVGPFETMFQNELKLERAFVAAGGLLLSGPDPTGNGGVLPGFGDQRGVELLVEAGFTPVEAIHIATYNGAEYLGRLDRIGTIAPGKQADLVVVRGDPSARIQDIESVEWVFRKGVGYDPEALIESVRGRVGLY